MRKKKGIAVAAVLFAAVIAASAGVTGFLFKQDAARNRENRIAQEKSDTAGAIREEADIAEQLNSAIPAIQRLFSASDLREILSSNVFLLLNQNKIDDLTSKFDAGRLTTEEKKYIKTFYEDIAQYGSKVYPEAGAILRHYIHGDGSDLAIQSEYFFSSPVLQNVFFNALDSFKKDSSKDLYFSLEKTEKVDFSKDSDFSLETEKTDFSKDSEFLEKEKTEKEKKTEGKKEIGPLYIKINEDPRIGFAVNGFYISFPQDPGAKDTGSPEGGLQNAEIYQYITFSRDSGGYTPFEYKGIKARLPHRLIRVFEEDGGCKGFTVRITQP